MIKVLSLAALTSLGGCTLPEFINPELPTPTRSPVQAASPEPPPRWVGDETFIRNQFFGGESGSQFDLDDKMEWNCVRFFHFRSKAFSARLECHLNNKLGNFFLPGRYYLASFYVRCAGTPPADEAFFWMRKLKELHTYGHGIKIAIPEIRKVWEIFYCPSPGSYITLDDPTKPFDKQDREPESKFLTWLFQGVAAGNEIASGGIGALDLYVGGFSVEEIEPMQRPGIAVFGDSTVAGNADQIDHPLSREWTTFAAAYTNAPCFNRAVGGYTTRRMRESWDITIAPIAQICKYCVLQGGLNDLAVGLKPEDIQENLVWMAQKSLALGLEPILTTLSPYNVLASIPEREGQRQEVNRWIRDTFSACLDLDNILRDPNDPSRLKQDYDWYGDGGHFGIAAHRAVGVCVADWAGWSLPKPSGY